MNETLIWQGGSAREDGGALAEWLCNEIAGARAVKELDQAARALKEDGDSRLLAVVEAPAGALATALSRGASLTDALAAWQEMAGRLLELYRGNRARVIIVEGGAIAENPARLAQVLGAEIQTIGRNAPAPQGTADQILMLLARHSLRESLDAAEIAEDLAACMTDISDGETLPAATAGDAFVVYQLQRAESEEALEAFRGLERKSEELRLSLDLQSKQNLAMLDEFENLQAERDQLVRRLEQVNSGLESLEAEAATLRLRIAQGEKRLTASEENAASMTQRIQGLMAELDTSRAERDGVQAELDRVMNSRSIRITAPMRKLGDALRRLRGRRP